MKRVPFSYSTFINTQKKAFNKASREKTTVSTVIHNFLLEYTAGEPDLTEQTAKPAASSNTADNEHTTGVIPESIHSEQNHDDGDSLQPPLALETEETTADPEPTAQPENKADGEKVEEIHSDNNIADQEPTAKRKAAAFFKKVSPTVTTRKKASSVAVKKSPDKKALKKVTPKPGVGAKKKSQAGKSNKSKAKS